MTERDPLKNPANTSGFFTPIAGYHSFMEQVLPFIFNMLCFTITDLLVFIFIQFYMYACLVQTLLIISLFFFFTTFFHLTFASCIFTLATNHFLIFAGHKRQ